MNEQSIAYEVPLHERLDTVPPNARLIIEDENGLGTTYIPIGREAKLAAAELRRLYALVDALEMCINSPWREGTKEYDVLMQVAKAALAKARGTE